MNSNFSQIEQKIHEHLKNGECAMEIASRFFITVSTAEKYISNIQKKDEKNIMLPNNKKQGQVSH